MGKTKTVLKQPCTNFVISLKNNTLITVSEYYTLKLWDINKVSCISTVKNEHQLTTVFELPNENIIIGTIGDIIQIRSVKNNLNCIKTICLNHYKGVENFSLLPNGKLAASSFKSGDFYILIFDLENEFNLEKTKFLILKNIVTKI
jgi:WD40 repeat protein